MAMRYFIITFLILLAGVVTRPGVALALTLQEKENMLFGPTTQVDPAFPYYQGRTAASIADEISQRGYKAVHLVITSEANPHGELIRELHKRGIVVWGMVWGGGTYSTAGFPPEWQEWRQTLIKQQDIGGFIYLSPFHPGFREYKIKAVAKLVQEQPLDGIEAIEAFWPNWNGLQSGAYGDIGPWAAKAFLDKTGQEMPNFTNRSDPRYYTKVPELYSQWVDFRVQAETDFLNDIFNGPGGVREVRPDILVATWSLATSGDPTLSKTREDIGEDPSLIVSTVKPDIHFFQTNWPDWIQAGLPANYPLNYAPFVADVRKVDPELPLGMQADIGSLEQMRRDWAWIHGVETAAAKAGFQTTTLYEYHIGRYMYEELPVVEQVMRNALGWVVLSFNKRIDNRTGSDKSNYQLLNAPGARVRTAIVDGNRVVLQISNMPKEAFDIVIENVTDTPELWLLKGRPANKVPANLKVSVPGS